MTRKVNIDPQPSSPFLTDFDLHLLAEGTHYRSFDKLGAHLQSDGETLGTRFAVLAPNARAVSVVGDFNAWNPNTHPMRRRTEPGVWEAFVPGAKVGALYKYAVTGSDRGYRVLKADPYAFASELRPGTASKVFELTGYTWGDSEWMVARRTWHAHKSPMSIYEVHLGSWQRVPEDGDRWLTYRELAPKLAAYAKDMGFTHVELLPVTEHPLDASWGYQTTGYFAPTSRFGTPHDFMYFVDVLHQHGIGVLMDWAPAHFPRDEHGLANFDGTALYEHADPRQGEHRDWGTKIFNFGRWEVRNFLISNALFWTDKYHIDGLRVDAVASMLYLDYSRQQDDWVANRYGGRENLDAVDFVRRCNELLYAEQEGVITVAEESTSWPMVSRPVYLGGLGFGFKWDMGWMNDTLRYLSRDPLFRKFHQNELTFRQLYAFTENFVLPLSHDEVVHGKSSLLGKMPGDDWQKFANLRLLFGYMYTQPGKKLLFMGGELAQWSEWKHDGSLDWHLLEHAPHRGVQTWLRDLNHFYKEQAALYELDGEPKGFEWVDCDNANESLLIYLRRGKTAPLPLVVACNFTPVPRRDVCVGVPAGGNWHECLNSDAEIYGGSNLGNAGMVVAERQPAFGRPFSLRLTLPPLAMIVLQPEHAAG